jgi:adenylate kinase
MKNTKPLNIFFLGAPASGKGTQASLLAKKFRLYQIDMGSLLRQWTEEAKKGDELAKNLKNTMAQGELVPSAIIVYLWVRELLKVEKNKGIISEGNPRTLEEANLILKLLEYLGRKNIRVIYLKVSAKEVRKRILSRVVCPRCGAEYSLRLEPGISKCPKCGQKLVKREDDNLKALEIRMKRWRGERQVVNFFRRQKLLLEINGEGPVMAIHQNIMAKLS